MTIEYELPDIGEGVVEGEVYRWLVSSGDAVLEAQPVVEVMTDFVTVEIPSPATGTMGEQRAAAGDLVPVGQVLFTIEEQPAT